MPKAIIIGGGVTGLSTAYHLARKGYGQVVVLEKDAIGAGSSSRAAGIITGLLWSETGVLARKISLRLFRELSQELSGYTFQASGCLNIFDQHSWAERAALLPLYERCEVPFEVLEPAEMRQRWPDLAPHDSWIGLFDPLGGYSEPDEYLPALAQACRRLGVDIREQQLVEELVLRNGQVAGVRTATALIEADAVVSTIYAWTNLLLERAGLRLPVKAFLHQRYVTEPLPVPLDIPAVNVNPLGGYIRPASGGRLLVGIETADREEYRIVKPDFQLSALHAAKSLKDAMRATFPSYVVALRHVGWDFEKVGLITFAMDGEPILGPVAQLPGLWIGVAFHSGGFAYNPVAGLLLAECVADGQPGIDIRTFSADRFDPALVESYLAETVAQKHVVRRRH